MSETPVPTPAPEPQKPTPTPPEPAHPTAPAASTVRSITPPWWAQRTMWSGISGIVVALLMPLMTPETKEWITQAGIILAALAGIFGRLGGTEAAAVVKEQGMAAVEKAKADVSELRWGKTPGG